MGYRRRISARLRIAQSVSDANNNYTFPAIEVGGVELFGNLNDGSELDITVAPFKDAHLAQWLRTQRLAQFARRASGSYDPVCLDLSGKDAEPPVVQLDHEDILLNRKKVRSTVLAKSIVELLQKAGA